MFAWLVFVLTIKNEGGADAEGLIPFACLRQLYWYDFLSTSAKTGSQYPTVIGRVTMTSRSARRRVFCEIADRLIRIDFPIYKHWEIILPAALPMSVDE